MYRADDKDAEFTYTHTHSAGSHPHFFSVHIPLPSRSVSFVPPLQTKGEDVKNLIKK